MKLYRKTSPPYMKLTQLFVEFFNSEKAGGILLLLATVVSLLVANSFLQDTYLSFWQYKLGGHTIVHWINDGLMTLFFLLIGLELEREIYEGELSQFKNATLPIIAAIGGMLVPAGIFLLLNHGLPTQDGAGIPMATDIAFAIGILSLLGNRVPSTVKILLTAIAVIDDLGAIIVIAIFYAGNISLVNLFIALGILAILLILNRLKVCSVWPYLAGGIVMWYFMLNSGVHPTIAGVLLAFAIPFGKTIQTSPSYKMQHMLHKPVAFIILPVFALANTSIIIGADWHQGLTSPNGLGILAGLVAGKPLGIFVFSFVASMLGIVALPEGLKWKQLFGIGLLTGIGFTMSIFITLLAFKDPELITQSKIAIFLASIISGILGLSWLRIVLKDRQADQ